MCVRTSRAGHDWPSVAVIVLNWNRAEDTCRCLESLERLDYPRWTGLVVDNGSTDGSVGVMRQRFPAVPIVDPDVNLGYTGGNNLGLHWALAQDVAYVLLLNNDTEVAPDMLRHLVRAAEDDPSAGMLGPTIYYYARPNVVWSAGGSIDWQRGTTQMIGLGEPDGGQFGQRPRYVDFVTGCALLVRRETLTTCGFLDDRFFAYYEDAEWCMRARRHGFRVVHVPTAHVWHKVDPSIRAASPLVHYYMTRNRLLFLRICGADGRAWVHTLLFDYARTLLSWTLRPRWRCRALQRHAMLRAIRDALLGRWGAARQAGGWTG